MEARCRRNVEVWMGSETMSAAARMPLPHLVVLRSKLFLFSFPRNKWKAMKSKLHQIAV